MLALPEDAGPVFTEDPRLHWHPLAAPLAQLHDEGKVSVMPAVGYTDPDQSHFTSRHYWEVGATQADLLTGWMGRYLDLVGTPDNPLQGLCLDEALQPALATARMPVATIDTALLLLLLRAGRVGAAAGDHVRLLRRARARRRAAPATRRWNSRARRR